MMHKKLITALVFVSVLVGILYLMQRVLQLNTGHRGTDAVKGFYLEEPDSLDVLFLGASTMFCTADPKVLEDEFGIKSYDFGASAQALRLTRLFTEEAFKTQHPKVVCVEMLGVCKQLKVMDSSSVNYSLMDLPLSWLKVRECYRMTGGDLGDTLCLLIPFVQYKDRWQELTAEDFVSKPLELSKGAYTPDLIADERPDFSEYYDADTTEPTEIPADTYEALGEIKALCDANGAQLLFFKAPNGGFTKGESLAIEKLAAEFDVPYINMFELMDEMGIDLDHDFRDNTHFNCYGSAKATRYIGEYLQAHYGL